MVTVIKRRIIAEISPLNHTALPVVLVTDGNSEIGAHAWSYISNLDLYKAFVYIKRSRTFKIFFARALHVLSYHLI